MPLPFSLVCDLLDQSHELCLARKPNTQAVIAWFARHEARINAPDSNLSALLSTLLPEKRTDRVYCIQSPSLEKIIGRALMLGSSRMKELTAYKQPGLGLDLADCVERILTVTPNPARPERLQVTVEDVDEVLHGIASKIKWSSPTIRTSQAAMSQRGRSDLESTYRQLSAREAKWFTRLVLKDYQPLIFDSHLVYRSCDAILPFVLKIQDDFATGIKTMQHAKGRLISMYPRTPSSDRKVLATIKPQLSVKVGRQLWFKARSIKHCLDMCRGQMSVEPKIDGEYCQIHVDTSKGRQGIRIFSKSGKDSTEDRQRLLGVIMESLRVGKPDSNIRNECILEGELVVYSDLEHKILPFHHIRKHVTRRGRWMNTEQDSPPRSYEHLMIIFYDILLLDGRSLLDVRHSERFKLLEKTIRCEKGQAELVSRQIIDTNHGLAASALRKAFAKIIVDKEEGLVLKPDLPYFNFTDYNEPFSGRVIKFKKEYIGNFGEVGDFAVVGAGFNSTKAKSYNIENLKWTHFYVGCLDNREEVKRWDAMPEFTVVNVVELNETMLRSFVSHGNPMPIPINENNSTRLKMAPGVQTSTPMTVAFTNPPVFDLRCFSFDKAGNTGFWSLRFPSVAKVHFDRDFSDTVSFEELQRMAKEAITAPELEDSQENLAWIAKLEGADPRGLGVDAATQLTATTMPTPSPRQPTQISASFPPLPKPTIINSQGRESESLQRRRASASQSQGLAERSQSLITPSNSFVVDETDQQKSPGSGKKKRSVSPSVTVSPSHKRRKSPSAEDSQVPPSPTRRKPWWQERRPLEDIDGNSTQQTPTPNVSFVEPAEISSGNVIDHPTRYTKPAKTSALANKTSGANSHFSQSPRAMERTVIVIPDSDDESSISSSPEPEESGGADGEVTQKAEAQQAERHCTYVGAKCQLANRMILLPADLPSHSTEMQSLFRAHGISNVTTGAEEWVKTDKIQSLSTQLREPGRGKIMFVDTVEMKIETKALLSRIEDIRKDLPEERRDWISVYDWRVLKHITILEDESITKKYYDGFHDPWRRWYCGLV